MEWGVAGQAGPRRSQWPGANVDSDENWRRAPWSPQQGVLVQKIMLIKQPPTPFPGHLFNTCHAVVAPTLLCFQDPKINKLNSTGFLSLH